ncbi:MAG: class I SAM-dependent methyltransferase [Microbacteriaceae bacterium]|nr:class I SAM-dependent methyltransferase [Microbacteriaceae bacterium]
MLLRAAAELRDPASGSAGGCAGSLVVIGDRHGALTLGAIQALGAEGLRVYQDPLLQERALAQNAHRLDLASRYDAVSELDESLVTGATLVLMQLPRSLAELEEIVWLIARYADPRVTVLAGGRDKHMTRGMNEVFARYFGEVTASRGWRKSRMLTATELLGAAPEQEPFPVWGRDPDVSFRIAAFGATFGGATLDHGSRLLLRTLQDDPPAVNPQRVIDLGCGNGVLTVSAALRFPDAEVLASDQSTAAVRATRLTAEAAGVANRVSVRRADGTEGGPEGWADLILLNPPFHTGSTVHTGVAHRLIRAAAGALAPGGELRIVFNSTLGYRPLVEQVVGETRQLARDRTFTVLSAIRRSEPAGGAAILK